MNTFTVANDQSLTALIGRARKRLVYIAPGVTPAVVDALRSLLEQPNPPNVTLIIDTDPEVCRLGYGTMEGLQALRALAADKQLAIRAQRGLRVGVLTADDELLVFSPVAQLVEDTPDSEARPNAIRLGSDPLPALLDAAAADGAPAGLPPSEAELGATPADPSALDRALDDLKRNPPKAFDLARVERVFSSKLMYVDLEVTGYRLSAHVVSLPNDLIVGSTAKLKTQLRNGLKLFQGSEINVEIPKVTATPDGKGPSISDSEFETFSEARITDRIKELRERYLHVLNKHGVLMYRHHQAAFDADVQVLQLQLRLFTERLSGAIEKALSDAAQQIGQDILELGVDRLPRRLTKKLPNPSPTREQLVSLVEAELKAVFGKARQRIDPQVTVHYKDISYQTICTKSFRDAITQHFGEETATGLFKEYDAARATAPATTPSAR